MKDKCSIWPADIFNNSSFHCTFYSTCVLLLYFILSFYERAYFQLRFMFKEKNRFSILTSDLCCSVDVSFHTILNHPIVVETTAIIDSIKSLSIRPMSWPQKCSCQRQNIPAGLDLITWCTDHIDKTAPDRTTPLLRISQIMYCENDNSNPFHCLLPIVNIRTLKFQLRCLTVVLFQRSLQTKTLVHRNSIRVIQYGVNVKNAQTNRKKSPLQSKRH